MTRWHRKTAGVYSLCIAETSDVLFSNGDGEETMRAACGVPLLLSATATLTVPEIISCAARTGAVGFEGMHHRGRDGTNART